MSKPLRITLMMLFILLIVLTVAPLILPLPPEGERFPPEALADDDSQFVTLNGIQVHYKTAGSSEPVYLLLHGFLANTYTWHRVFDELAQNGRVIAFDRPAFGLSGRPLAWEGENPYSMISQVRLAVALLDHLDVDKAVFVGNSAGGTVAAEIALAHPERTQALVLLDAAIYSGGGAPSWIKPLLATPQARRIGLYVVRRITGGGNVSNVIDLAWHDPSSVTLETLEGYRTTFQVENWDKALWEFTLASRESRLAERIQQVQAPVLVLTGDDDRIVPTEESIRLAGEIPRAELVVFPNCGHVPQEECPESFLQAVKEFLITVK
jgi:pimeloyl-ACP methyl ester carboxylesterase